MSHIHLPDGLLPLWLWLGGYLLTALIVGLLFRRREGEGDARRFALLGAFAALMLLVMSIVIPPFYHANLSVVTGIVLGPALGILAAFIVNLLLALMGHGGITVVGVNMLPLMVEILAGYGLFLLLRRLRLPLFGAGMLAVVVGLMLGTAASYGILTLGAPSINRTMQMEHAHEHGEEHGDEHGDEDGHAPSAVERASAGGRLNLGRLAVLMFGVGAVGWVLEGVLGGAVLAMLDRMFPAMLPGRRRREEPEEEASDAPV